MIKKITSKSTLKSISGMEKIKLFNAFIEPPVYIYFCQIQKSQYWHILMIFHKQTYIFLDYSISLHYTDMVTVQHNNIGQYCGPVLLKNTIFSGVLLRALANLSGDSWWIALMLKSLKLSWYY